MGLSIYLPNTQEKKASIKDLAVLILSQDWPLTAKKIYMQVQKRFAKTCTYQAVFKSLRELEENEVIEKTSEGYCLNTKWLKHVQAFTKTTETRYFSKDRHNIIEGMKDSKQEGSISILTFETMFDVEKYLYYLQKDYISRTTSPKIICYHHKHEWRPIFYMRAEYNWVQKLAESKHKYYILCSGNTPTDKYCERFYKSMGASIKLNANCASTCELMIVDDLVIEIYLPSSLTAEMDKEFGKIKSPADLKGEELIRKIFEKKENIQVIIKKDRNIAKQIEDYTLQFFQK